MFRAIFAESRSMQRLASIRLQLGAAFAAAALLDCLTLSGWSWWTMRDRQAPR